MREANKVLIGEILMRVADKLAVLEMLRGDKK